MTQNATVKEWVVERDGPVAYLKFALVEKPLQDFLEHHLSAALALESVRWDDTVRVVVIAGGDDGNFEVGPPAGANWDDLEEFPHDVMYPGDRPGGPGSLRGPWSKTHGIQRTWETLALMDKPVVGRINGDAYGFAMHLMWGCDIVVAREDAKFCDYHLTLSNEMPYGMSAGDGAFAFMPLFTSPTKLKEFLLLGPSWTGRQLADLNMINYAVPEEELFPLVDKFVQQFLERPVRALARTKRAANKRLIEQMNLTMDYAWLAESTDHWELPSVGWKADTSMHADEPNWTVTDPGDVQYADPQHRR
jgi:enoyl-CoA hydratase/carnithine racemase